MSMHAQVLGYTVRWTVDKADHVWAEVKIKALNVSGEVSLLFTFTSPYRYRLDALSQVDEAWVHLDPCEAAVDEPLLYQNWGKNITYIFAYSMDHHAVGQEDMQHPLRVVPPEAAEDVTLRCIEE
jgi:hypothetical protein